MVWGMGYAKEFSGTEILRAVSQLGTAHVIDNIFIWFPYFDSAEHSFA